jgi:hypothetical protein
LLLLLLGEGSLVEVPGAVDVIHRAGQIDCVGEDGSSLVTFNSNDVMAYTTSPETQARWLKMWSSKS